MEQMAVVKSVQSNGMAQVSVRRTTACAHDCDKCAGCEQLNTRMENTVLAYNDAQASPGDLVRLQSENATFFKTAAIVYVLPLVLALLTAVSSGLAYTMIAFCRGQVAPMTVIFHFSLFSTIAAGLLMIPSFVVPTPRDLMMLVLIGIFGAGGQIGLTYAYQKAPAAEVSIYDYSGIIFSAILGYVLLGESLSLSTVVGAALITAGGLWSYCANRKQAAANR